MKQKLTILVAVMLLITVAGSAQTISADSAKVLTANNKLLRMAIDINDLKLDLAKLQNKLVEEEEDMQKVARASQKAADKNKTAATRLSKDNQDEDKADAAKKTANNAERRSTKARKAQDKLSGINKDIEKMKHKIAESETKLTTMGGAKYMN